MAEILTVRKARRRGMEWRDLQTRRWVRLRHGVYGSLDGDQLDVYRAALVCSPPGTVLSGRTAGWVYRMDIEHGDRVELNIGRQEGVSVRTGARVRRDILTGTEVTRFRGLPITTPLRTLYDLAAHEPLNDAVIAADSALRRRLVTLPALEELLKQRGGRKGVRRFRRVVSLAEPRSESAMETRLRLALIAGGLPRPAAQVKLGGAAGHVIARADLYYAEARLVIEYDGRQHGESLAPITAARISSSRPASVCCGLAPRTSSRTLTLWSLPCEPSFAPARPRLVHQSRNRALSKARWVHQSRKKGGR